ncbi:hypothetical protein LSTR_LSTR003341 [Laodelphax striatellus]|uniref:Uncharacterized protein n=1 Tax=Laodelphax striatellus TaxID=195883 RepID=A0A482X6B7_LAOST|nr:hypothetical protein LSTR_LSTR003341 [Laodelphax striatellus]
MNAKLYSSRGERMAPGSGSMLRSRRRDVNVKPNRLLDRSSSRGMIYENEELRLRTININAEVERGQHDIKKLRRENEQLRREIWSLREEYDRLEALLKSKQQQNDDAEESEDEDEDSDEKDEADQENASNQEKVSNKDIDMLSVVEEEPEDNSTEGDGDRLSQQLKREGNTLNSEGLPAPFLHIPDAGFIDQSGNAPTNGIKILPETIIPNQEPALGAPNAPGNQGGIPAVYPEDLEQLIRNCTFPLDPDEMCRPSTEPNQNFMTAGSNNFRNPRTNNQSPQGFSSNPLQPGTLEDASQEQLPTSSIANKTRNGPILSNDLRCQPYAGQSPSFLRLNCVHPHTVFFPVNSPEFSNLTVQEVIDALSEQLPDNLLSGVRGVRLVGGACYLSVATDADAKALTAAAPRLRGATLRLEDASVGTAYIALAGVPHDVTDQTVAEALAPFGTVIGTVERRIYRGVDTGERLARLRPKLAIPRFLWFGGCRAVLRLMKEEEVGALALARRKSFRSHLHIKLKTNEETSPQVPPLPGDRNRQSLAQNSVAQSVPNLAPTTTLSVSPPLIGFSTTQSVPDLTVQPPQQQPPPKPQFFSSTTGASNNVFLFPPPDTPHPSSGSPYAIRRHSSIVPPSIGNTQQQIPNGSVHPHQQMPNGSVHPNVTAHPTTDSGAPHHQRSQSTPPVPNPNPSPIPTRRQNSQSDSEAPKPPDTPNSTKTRRVSRKVSKTGSQPNLAPLDTKKANGDASSSSGQDSPSKPSRRRASVYFKRPGSFRRQTSMEQMEGTAGELTTTCSERERSNSDVSSRTSGGFRRKMSETGREVGKVPWCGCWGNGCL